MSDTLTVKDEIVASNLLDLAVMCDKGGTDCCDIILSTKKGQIKCSIELLDKEL